MFSKVRDRLRVSGFLAICSIIAGCAGTHGIAPQDQALNPAQIASGAAIAAAARDADWPTEQWWGSLGDAQLNRLIDTALADNPSLAMAQARVRLAAAMAGVSAAALSPQLQLDASIAREHWPDNYFYGPGALGGANTWNNTAALGLSYNLDLWGRDRALADRALDDAHATAIDARAAQLELETNIVRAYIAYSLQYALRDNLVRILAEQQRVLDYGNARLKGGIGTQLEVAQAQTPLPETQRQIDVLDEQLALQRNQLAALTGQGPGAGDGLRRPTLAAGVQVARLPNLPSNLPLDLLGHRPDVVAQRWRIEEQSRGIAAAKAAFYPDVNLVLSAGGYAAAGGPVGGGLLTFLSHSDMSYSAGPALSLPIFNGGRLRAQLGAQAADYDLAIDRYNQIVLDAIKQVADPLVTLKSLDQQEHEIDASLATARQSDALATEGYRRGLTDYLNVLNAQAHVLLEEQNEERLRARRLDTYAVLMEALGGGVLDDRALAAPAIDPHPGDKHSAVLAPTTASSTADDHAANASAESATESTRTSPVPGIAQ